MDFALRLVHPGARYGRDDALVNRYDDVLVEFYDAEYADDERFGPEGQFVSRYMLRTLNMDRASLTSGGLDLQGDVPKWKLTGDQMRAAFAQIDEMLKPAA